MQSQKEILDLVIGVNIIIGLLQCFFGYRIFKIILGIIGFMLGGGLAFGIGFGASQELGVGILSGLVGGVIGAVLIVVLYFVGVFLVGAGLGAIVAASFSLASGSAPEPMILIVVAVIGGVLAVIFQKLMIILSTSFGGAWSVVAGISHFAVGRISFDPRNPEATLRALESKSMGIVLGWIILGVFGVIVQYKVAPKPPPEGKSVAAEPTKG